MAHDEDKWGKPRVATGCRDHPPPGRCLVFAYGLLQPGLQPPQTLGDSWPDEVQGLLYDLGPYPAAVQIGRVSTRFAGHVLNISDEELERLDGFEGVPEGQYRRIRTTTASGVSVWVYEYIRSLPATAVGPLRSWPAEPTHT